MSTGDEKVGPKKSRREGWPRSSSLNSGSSIDTPEDRRARHRHASSRDTRGSSYTTTFSRREERKICRSLRCKLLSNNGALLSRIERRLLHAGHRGDGLVPVAAFKDALAEGRNRDERGRSIVHDEKIWLVEKLRTRNGKRVSIFNIRRLLESGGQGQGESHGRPRHGERAMGPREPEEAPPKWVIRQGTVGQWLHNVASPMERKFFFEFVRGLEKFERNNGLDFYRVQPGEKGGIGGRGCDGGTTVLHLGPMLKAEIKFYV